MDDDDNHRFFIHDLPEDAGVSMGLFEPHLLEVSRHPNVKTPPRLHQAVHGLVQSTNRPGKLLEVLWELDVNLLVDIRLKECLLDVEVSQLAVLHSRSRQHESDTRRRRCWGECLLVVETLYLPETLGH